MLEELARLTHLRVLGLRETRVDHNSYDYLASFPDLIHVFVKGATIPKDDAYKKIHQIRPDMEFDWEN